MKQRMKRLLAYLRRTHPAVPAWIALEEQVWQRAQVTGW